jgi:hypothetical protein
MTTMEKLDRVSALLDKVAQLSLGHPDRLRLLTIAEQIFEVEGEAVKEGKPRCRQTPRGKFGTAFAAINQGPPECAGSSARGWSKMTW